jgi:hypothetical protein
MQAKPEPDDDSDQRIERALKIWDAAKPLARTLGEKYLTEIRALTKLGELDALRYHAGFDAVMALMTDPVTNEPCGVHRTFLNRDGTKREKKMLGLQGVVRLTPDEDVTQGLAITEGIENALAVLFHLDIAPCWAATCAGGIERFPLLGGIECLTIFRDDGTRQGTRCALRSLGIRRMSKVEDWNDVIRLDPERARRTAEQAKVWTPKANGKAPPPAPQPKIESKPEPEIEPEEPALWIGDWIKRDLPDPDRLLGDLLTTTSRVEISANGAGQDDVRPRRRLRHRQQ